VVTTFDQRWTKRQVVVEGEYDFKDREFNSFDPEEQTDFMDDFLEKIEFAEKMKQYSR
jgi:hypothetical protein